MGTQPLDNAPMPPYVPFKTFINFIDLLKDTAVPSRIDRSVMAKYPGSIQTQLRTALRYIGAIDDSSIVQPLLREMVKQRGTDTWRDEFGVHFWNWYKGLLGDLDTDTATLQQLKERFKAAGVEGSVLIKATRFFLAGMEESGTTYSPHFKVRGALTGGNAYSRPKKPKAKRTTATEFEYANPPGESEILPGIPQGFDRLALPLPGRAAMASLTLPADLTTAEWAMIDAYIKLYFKPEGKK